MKRILLILAFLGNLSAFAGDLGSPSWSATSNVAGQTATYTFSYTAVTASPNMVIYALLNTSPTPSFNFNLSTAVVTVNGSPAAINTGSSWGMNDRFVIRLSDPTLVTVGANIVVTIQATNSPNGTYTWNWIRTADPGGNEVDGYRNPPAIQIGALSTTERDANKTNINLYPNPISDILQIDAPNNNILNTLEIYNLYGATIKRYNPLVSSFKIDVNDLPNGVYILKINTTEKDPYIRKIVVRH